MVYVIQVSCQLASRIRKEPSWSCSQAVSKPVWHIPLLCVQWKTPDDGQRNCPKHVEFYSKNMCEKLVHLVGFIMRIYHVARSPEHQIPFTVMLINLQYISASNSLVEVNCFISYCNQTYRSVGEGWKVNLSLCTRWRGVEGGGDTAALDLNFDFRWQ